MDKSLSDIIAEKNSGGGNRRRGGHGGSRNQRRGGGARRGNNGGNNSKGGGRVFNPLDRSAPDPEPRFAPNRGRKSSNRYTPYGSGSKSMRADSDGMWARGEALTTDSSGGRSDRSERRNKAAPRTRIRRSKSGAVSVFNLSSQVEEEDLFDIFEETGTIVSAKINSTKDGEPDGSATVTFETREQAVEAVEEFNLAKVDGRPMTLMLTEPDEERPVLKVEKSARRVQKVKKVVEPRGNRNGGNNNRNNNGNRNNNRGAARRRPSGPVTKASLFGSMMDTSESRSSFKPRRTGGGHGGRGNRRGGRGGKGRNGGRGAKKEAEPTEADLDAEMDAYLSSKAE